ncbi:kallikrein-13-like [Perca flavescens]|uniref:kallikrein-13-like n=1 Tax=Perca flavescens TaxID=8167 RepID=UPI00106E83B2|nr:kallikrein-13-like [Perca flavescens]
MKVVLGWGQNKKTLSINEKPVMCGDDHIHHDIMLLKLPTPTSIEPVPLPDCGIRLKPGTMVQIAGHAATAGNAAGKHISGFTPDLQCADTKVTTCPSIGGLIRYQHKFCGDTGSGVTSCPGDSGGGVVYDSKIYGVIHGAVNGIYVCAGENIFMDVCKYLGWIKHITKPPKKMCLWCG